MNQQIPQIHKEQKDVLCLPRLSRPIEGNGDGNGTNDQSSNRPKPIQATVDDDLTDHEMQEKLVSSHISQPE